MNGLIDGRNRGRKALSGRVDPELVGVLEDIVAPRLWLFTAKVNGKTVNKRLSEPEAQLYQQWIDNDRKAKALLAQMRAVAAEAAALILAEQSE